MGEAWEQRVDLGADPVTAKQRFATRTVRAGTASGRVPSRASETDRDKKPPGKATHNVPFVSRG